MKILALETIGVSASVALLEDGVEVRTVRLDAGEKSARALVPAVQRLLGQAGWKAEDIGLVAVAEGPGSFTGLRVGITFAKTFAYTVHAAVIGVLTLEALAAGTPAECSPLSVAMDAQRGDVVVQDFVFQPGSQGGSEGESTDGKEKGQGASDVVGTSGVGAGGVGASGTGACGVGTSGVGASEMGAVSDEVSGRNFTGEVLPIGGDGDRSSAGVVPPIGEAGGEQGNAEEKPGKEPTETAGRWVAAGACRMVPFEEWIAALPQGTYLNSAILQRKARQIPAERLAFCVAPEYREPNPVVIGRLAWERFQAGQPDAIWTLLPVYSRLAAAEERKKLRG